MEGKKGLIQSICRAAAVLRCFDGQTELGLSEISRMVGLHKSTAAGIVNTLKAEQFLEQNEHTGKLRLGIELFRLSAGVHLELQDLCRPYHTGYPYRGCQKDRMGRGSSLLHKHSG